MKKYYVQPTGAWGIIMWSLALSIIFLGIILQLELFDLSVIPFVIWVIGIIYIFYIVTNSWVKVSDTRVIVKEPNYYKERVFQRSDVNFEFTDRIVRIKFNNHNYFPLSITSTKKILSLIKKEAGE